MTSRNRTRDDTELDAVRLEEEGEEEGEMISVSRATSPTPLMINHPRGNRQQQTQEDSIAQQWFKKSNKRKICEIGIAGIIIVVILALVLTVMLATSKSKKNGNLPVDFSNSIDVYLIESMSDQTSSMKHSRSKFAVYTTSNEFQEIHTVPTIILQNGFFNMTFINQLMELSIIHAHGLTPPVEFDGVQYLPTAPMHPSQNLSYAFNISDEPDGTYFMHSHFGFQMCDGISMPLIIKRSLVPSDYPLSGSLNQAEEVVMFLQDVCPYHNSGEKNDNCDSFKVFDKLEEEWKNYNESAAGTCPPPKDMDVMFENHEANGKLFDVSPHNVFVHIQNPIRLRVINSASMTHYMLTIPNELSPIAVATDGKLINPLESESQLGYSSFWMATAQRFDFLLSAQKTGNYCIVAYVENHVEERSGICIIITESNGSFDLRNVFVSQPPNVTFMATETEKLLSAWKSLDFRNPDVSVQLNLTGDNGFNSMNGYSYRLVPFVTRQTSNPFPIFVKYGNRVHIKITNFNADSHAMHLHGHLFQVIEIDDVPMKGALRDTVLVPGGCHSVKIAFDAINPGTWLFHCHMDFHMAAGMITTIEYLN